MYRDSDRTNCSLLDVDQLMSSQLIASQKPLAATFMIANMLAVSRMRLYAIKFSFLAIFRYSETVP